jgi:hypothetical protein
MDSYLQKRRDAGWASYASQLWFDPRMRSPAYAERSLEPVEGVTMTNGLVDYSGTSPRSPEWKITLRGECPSAGSGVTPQMRHVAGRHLFSRQHGFNSGGLPQADPSRVAGSEGAGGAFIEHRAQGLHPDRLRAFNSPPLARYSAPRFTACESVSTETAGAQGKIGVSRARSAGAGTPAA